MKRVIGFICALSIMLMSFVTVCAQGVMYPHPEVETEIAISDEGEIKNFYGRKWKTVTGEVVRADMEYGELRYSVYLPEGYDINKEYPILLFLHGGSIGYLRNAETSPWSKDLDMYSEPIARGIEDCIILAPQAPGTPYSNNVGNTYWSGLSSEEMLDGATINVYDSSPYLRATEKLMAEFFENGISHKGNTYKIDTSRVYLAGHSQGGVGSFSILKDCPEIFTAAIIGAGIGDPDAADLWKNTPVRIIHGTKDAKITYKAAELMQAAIKDHPNSKLITVDDGHDIKPYMYTEENFSWMAKQDRNASGSMQTILLILFFCIGIVAITIIVGCTGKNKR